jgi:hypothetical protein
VDRVIGWSKIYLSRMVNNRVCVKHTCSSVFVDIRSKLYLCSSVCADIPWSKLYLCSLEKLLPLSKHCLMQGATKRFLLSGKASNMLEVFRLHLGLV